jgi:hypothetical protein
VDNSATFPPDREPRFAIGEVVVYRSASAALGPDYVDLVRQLIADHLQHAEPYQYGWIGGVRYQGQQIAVTTVPALNETHVFAAAEARPREGDTRAAVLRNGELTKYSHLALLFYSACFTSLPAGDY